MYMGSEGNERCGNRSENPGTTVSTLFESVYMYNVLSFPPFRLVVAPPSQRIPSSTPAADALARGTPAAGGAATASQQRDGGEETLEQLIQDADIVEAYPFLAHFVQQLQGKVVLSGALATVALLYEGFRRDRARAKRSGR